jgi:glycosyltransferase involved in cell wall biosynthesis
MKTSVIITTYNSPLHLKKVLLGLANQTDTEFDVVIADDGSTKETADMLDSYREEAPYEIYHIWHEDLGPRKCTILNKAILEAPGEYLVFLDGDCVPQKNMIAVHKKYARKDRYVTGGAVCLTQEFTDSLSEDDIRNQKLEKFGLWWFGTTRPRRLIIAKFPSLAYKFDRNIKRLPGWRGGNASTFKSCLLDINGFDERFSIGREDADTGHRLECNGVLGFSVRYTTPVYHLEHARGYSTPKSYVEGKTNVDIYDENRAVKLTYTPYGINKSDS